MGIDGQIILRSAPSAAGSHSREERFVALAVLCQLSCFAEFAGLWPFLFFWFSGKMYGGRLASRG